MEQSLGARLSSYVSTGAPSRLFVELIILTNNALAVEKMLHTRLKQYRSRGEWFEIDCLWSVLDPFEFDEQMRVRENLGLQVSELKNEINELEKRRDFYRDIEEEISKKILSLADQLGIGGGKLFSNKQFIEDLKGRIDHIIDIEKRKDIIHSDLCARERSIEEQERKLIILREKIKEEYEKSRRPSGLLQKFMRSQ